MKIVCALLLVVAESLVDEAILEEKDATIRALHKALMRTRGAAKGRRRLEEGEYDWSNGCSDAEGWSKMDDTSKDCAWVSDFPEARCGFEWGNAGTRGWDGTFALESCPMACGNCEDSMYSEDDVHDFVYAELTAQIGFDDFVLHTPEVDQTVSRVQNAGQATRFDAPAGFNIYNEFNPEAQFYLANAGDDSLVRDMQGDVFQFPETSNEPSEVEFELPEPPPYESPSDLYYMPILSIASLLRNGDVSCVEVVQAFIDRLSEFDPYLGIVATPLYEEALATAAEHDELLARDTYISPLMCIPFGLKDHHQIEDEPTMYGSILHANNVQTVKSTVMHALIDAGAIPIAKMQLGTFAWSSANAWGECMSPYLNGPGCGSSCGSGSGAALGALPFAISEETSGSIACPSSANLISGHIASYGVMSRAGAGLLCSETDHLGFHSRYLSDFGVILNYARTGVDPLDGDSVAVPYQDPASIDVSQLKVLIIEGEGKWAYDEESESWSWDNTVTQSYSKTAWHWPERVANIKAALDEAGVEYTSVMLDEAEMMWSFNETTPYFDCASPQIDVMMAAGPWAQTQEFEFAFQNSKWKTYYPKNIPKKAYRYLQVKEKYVYYVVHSVDLAVLHERNWGKVPQRRRVDRIRRDHRDVLEPRRRLPEPRRFV